MSDKYQDFISIYNKLETIIHKIPNAPDDANMKWLEDSLPNVNDKNKLYLCRIIRNYIQHNEDYRSFVSVTDGMITFLNNIYINNFAKLLKAEDIMISINKTHTKEITDNASESIDFMLSKKINFLPILDNEKISAIATPLSALTGFKFIKKTSQNKFLIDNKIYTIPKDNIKFVSADKTLDEIIEIFDNTRTTKKPIDLIIVTETGNVKGKALGTISPFEAYNFKI